MKNIETKSRPCGVKNDVLSVNNNILETMQSPLVTDKNPPNANLPKSLELQQDQAYFEQYIGFFDGLFQSGTNECAFVKDTNLIYHAVTAKKVKLMGALVATDMLGKTFQQVAESYPLYDQEMIEHLIEQDKSVMDSKKTGTYLEVLHYKGERKIFVHYKYPIINPATGNCVGLRGQITNLILPHVVKTLLQMHGAKGLLIGNKNNKLADPLKEYGLTETQHMVLFLALNNYSYSEIAVLLGAFGQQVTPIRVNDHLEQLKLIFHVRNKVQLIEKAIGLGLHTIFPAGLFNKLTSIDISNDKATITNTAD